MMLTIKDIRENLEGWLAEFDSIAKTVLFLDDDPVFLNVIKYKCRAHNDELVTLSNAAEFRAFTHSPDRKSIAKAFIDINLSDECGIGLAKSMKLNQSETQLFFVSGTDATTEQKTQISELGGTFLLKENLVKTVIFPETEETKD